MFRKFFCVLALAAFASSANAGVLGSSISFDGNPDFLSDDSLGVFIDTGTDGIADVVQGIVNLTGSTLSAPGTINELTGGNLYAAYSFAIELDVANSLVNPLGPASVLAFDATGAPGAGLTVGDLMSSLNVTVNDLATTSVLAGDPLVVLFTDNGGPTEGLSVFENLAGANSAIDLEYSGSASELDIVLTAGFDGDDDYYSLDNTVFGPLASPSSFGGVFNGVLSVLSHEFGSSVKFLDIEDENGAFGNIVIEAEAGPGSGTFSSSEAQGFTFGDNASFVVNAVPEPSSLFAFAAIGLAGLTRRRRG